MSLALSQSSQDDRSAAQELSELSRALGVQVVEDLSDLQPHPRFVEKFSIAYARQHALLGLRKTPIVQPNTLPNETPTEPQVDECVVVICNRQGWTKMDTVARMLRCGVSTMLASEEQIQLAINRAYSDRDSQTAELLQSMETDDLVEAALQSQSEDLLDSSARAPIIQLVNQVLFDAVVAGASDVHIQPAEEHLMVRQRIDGILFDTQRFPKSIQEEVLTRVKVLGKMNIAEKRLPQDGRATVELGDRKVDLRIASLPTSHNERIVIRLLDKSARLYTLGELGMAGETLTQWRSLIRRDHGLILVTGPTGSGKSTTLYSALQEINSSEMNVLTLEDPIEYQLDGISQSQINEKKGMTFASGMRSVLRQDPDIIMIGEIRDRDTANMAIQASLTGHLVFSTLHTNDAASAVTRLLDLGVEPYLVASSMVASLAQRLVRQLCPECRRPIASSDVRENKVDVSISNGCDACRHTGFAGRLGLFELLIVDDHARELVQERANAAVIREHAITGGMSLLSEDGILKAKRGDTTLAEVLRATSVDAEQVE